jgi:transposase
MALRQGQREQLQMLPPSIEQYIDQEAPVRVYDAFVEALDLAALGIQINPTREGNPAYDPRAMLKLLVYGYSYGVRSSRKLEREVYYNLSFIWLMGGLRPDHKTIAEFRRGNKAALKQALTQCVKLCLKLDLIAGNILFVDGSKIRGNAAIKNTWDQDKCRKVLEKAEQRIAEILAEAESMDQAEEGLPSLTSLPSELTKASNLKQRVEEIMGELQASGHKSLNTVDPECNRMNSLEGTHAGYNAQVVVDDKQGLIVEADVVRNNNDLGQFSAQIAQAVDILGKLPQVGVADSGYSDTPDLVKIDRQQIQVIVPS